MTFGSLGVRCSLLAGCKDAGFLGRGPGSISSWKEMEPLGIGEESWERNVIYWVTDGESEKQNFSMKRVCHSYLES